LMAMHHPDPIVFPVLEELEISYTMSTSNLPSMLVAMHTHPCAKWTMPALRTLTAKNVIPEIAEEYRRNITSLSVRLEVGKKRREQSNMKWPLPLLGEYFPKVKSLSLTMSYDTFSHVWRTVQLPSVERLSIKFVHAPLGAIVLLCRALEFPNVSKMELDLRTKNKKELSVALLGCLFPVDKYAKLSVKHDPEPSFPVTKTIRSMIGRFEILETMRLEVDPCCGCVLNGKDNGFKFGKRMRTVHLKGVCGTMANEFLEAVGRAEKREGSAFESIVVENYGRMPMRKGSSFVYDSGRTFSWSKI